MGFQFIIYRGDYSGPSAEARGAVPARGEDDKLFIASIKWNLCESETPTERKKNSSANQVERTEGKKRSPTERENSLWVVQIENQLFGKVSFVRFYFIDFSRITSFICAYLDVGVLFSSSDFHPQVRCQTWISVTLSK